MSEADRGNEVAHGIAQTVNSRPRLGETRDCLDPWYQPFILTNGDVWPCCWFYESLGNVNDTPFHKLINSSAFQKLRHELLTGELRNACIECPSRGITTADKLLARLRSTPGRAG
jgi:radical SAM protein with 4Fe4S-binding SPASM domain